MSELGKVNIEENENRLNNFLNACKRTLEIQASRSTQGAIICFFMNKTISKEIMTRTRLPSKFLKETEVKKTKKVFKTTHFVSHF